MSSPDRVPDPTIPSPVPAPADPVMPPLEGVAARLSVDDAALAGLWESINATLDEDADCGPLLNARQAYNFDAASAYTDGEGLDRDEREQFERVLGQDRQLSGWVSDAQTVSDWVKSYAYRLETQCSIDCSVAVLNQYSWPHSADLPGSAPAQPLSESDQELLQPWHDEQPLDAEQGEFIRLLLRYEPAARDALTGLQALSERLSDYRQRIQSQVPELDELTVKRLARESTAQSAPARQVGNLMKLAVATVLLTVVSFNVFGWLEQRHLGTGAGVGSSIASAVLPGTPVAYGRTAVDIEPGASSGWVPGGPDGPYQETTPPEAGESSAPRLLDSQSMQPPSAEDYLINLQNRDYSLNEYEMSVDL